MSVERNIPLNTSDHVPVFAQLSVEAGRKERAETTTVQLKPKWDGCDKHIYKDSIRQNLKQFESFIPSLTEEIDILQPLAHLNAVLKQATRDSIPNHKTSLKIKGRRRCWTQKMKDAMKNSRLMLMGVAQSRGTRGPERPNSAANVRSKSDARRFSEKSAEEIYSLQNTTEWRIRFMI